jgi:hypothetical protein
MTRRLPSGRAAFCAVLLSTAVLACETEITNIDELVGDAAFNFVVGPSAATLPSGAANREVVRTLQRRVRVWYDTLGVRYDTVIPLSPGRTQDTLAVDSATVVMVRGLRAQAAGVYQVWGQTPGGTVVPVYGRVVEYSSYFAGEFNPITGDSLFSPDSAGFLVGSVNTYPGSDNPKVDSVAFQLVPSDLANTINPFVNADINALFVSIEAAQAAAPSTRQFLWRRIGIATDGATTSDQNLKIDTVVVSANPVGPGDPVPDTLEITTRARRMLVGTGTLTFGNFGGFDVANVASPRDYVFTPRGAGTGGARGPELSVDIRELGRPPLGFFYVGYVVDRAGVGVLVDTLRSAWSPDSSVSRRSLYDADVSDILPGVVGDAIRAAQVRNCAAGSAQNNCQNSMALPATGTFVGYESFHLKLEPKGGVAPSQNKSVTHAGGLPGPVK